MSDGTPNLCLGSYIDRTDSAAIDSDMADSDAIAKPLVRSVINPTDSAPLVTPSSANQTNATAALALSSMLAANSEEGTVSESSSPTAGPRLRRASGSFRPSTP